MGIRLVSAERALLLERLEWLDDDGVVLLAVEVGGGGSWLVDGGEILLFFVLLLLAFFDDVDDDDLLFRFLEFVLLGWTPLSEKIDLSEPLIIFQP